MLVGRPPNSSGSFAQEDHPRRWGSYCQLHLTFRRGRLWGGPTWKITQLVRGRSGVRARGLRPEVHRLGMKPVFPKVCPMEPQHGRCFVNKDTWENTLHRRPSLKSPATDHQSKGSEKSCSEQSGSAAWPALPKQMDQQMPVYTLLPRQQ